MGKNRYHYLVYSKPWLKERIRLKPGHHSKQNVFFLLTKVALCITRHLFFFFSFFFFFFFHKLNYFHATFHREAVKDIITMGKGAALEKDINFNKAKRSTDKRVTREGGWERSSKYLSNTTKK